MITLDMARKNLRYPVSDQAFEKETGVLILQIELEEDSVAYDLTGKTVTAVFDPMNVETAELTVTDGVIELPINPNLVDVGMNYIQINIRDGETLEQSPIMKWEVQESLDAGETAAEYVNLVNSLVNEITTARGTFDNVGARMDDVDSQLSQIANKTDRDYGFSWNGQSSPTLIRTDDAKGMSAIPGVDDTVNFNEFDDSAIFDWEEVEDSYGNKFVRMKPIWVTKERVKGNYRNIYSTKKKNRTGEYLPYIFWDFANGKVLEGFDVGKHRGVLSDDTTKLESKAGKYPLVNKNIVDFRNLARANGAGYQQYDVHAHDLIEGLFRTEFATLNSQSICAGFTSGQYNASHVATVAESGVNRIIIANAYADLFRAGQAISIGTTLGGNQIFYGRTITAIDVYDGSNKAISFDGDPVDIAIGNIVYNTGYKTGFSENIEASVGSIESNSEGKHPFVWHGIESIFGDAWCFVDGININDYHAWVCKDADDYASNVFANPYEQLGFVNADTDGYIIEMGFDTDLPFAEFPITSGGGSTTYFSDYYYREAGQRIARVGGSWTYGSSAGLSCWHLYYPSSYSNVNIGGRILRKPL